MMGNARQPRQNPKFNTSAPDPIMDISRNRHYEQRFGRIMQPVPLSLVIGEKGSGVSTLLNTYRQRPDTENTLIVDEGEGGLPEAWDSEAIAAWLATHQQTYPTNIVLASSDLRAPRQLLQALVELKLGRHFRLDAVTGVANALTWSAAGWDGAGFDGAAEPEKAGGSTIATKPQRQRHITTSDRIILTHTDRAQPSSVRQLATALKALNPAAPVLRAYKGDIGPARLVASGLFDPLNGSVDIDRWLCEAAFNFEAARRSSNTAGLNLPEAAFAGLSAASGVRFFAITLDQPIDSAVLSVFLKLLMADHGADLLRLKGIIATQEHADQPGLIDGREHLIQPLLWLPTWPTTDRRTRLVFSMLNCSETWVRQLLTILSDQLNLVDMSELQLVMAE